MGKRDDINQLINLMSVALRHKIGSIVNKEEIYALKYARDAEVILKEAEKVARRHNWNRYQKEEIRQKLKNKLFKELEEKDFLDNKKFNIMDEEMDNVLRRFCL